MEPLPVDAPTAAAGPTEPAVLDIEGYLTDSRAELHRCATESWYAQGVDLEGRPLPLVLGYDHVRAVLRDRRLSARSFTDDMIAAGLSIDTAHQLTPLFSRHGDEHRFFRSLLSAAFTPRSVEKLRPFAAEVAGRLADDIAAGGGVCEFVSSFAAPLPPEVFARLFGLPLADRDRLARWGSVVTEAFVPPLADDQIANIEATAAEMRAWSAGLIEARRTDPTDDLISGLLAVEDDGQCLDDIDITAIITGFVFAGSETTRRQLTQMIAAFADHPESWTRVADDPELIASAIEEVLRLYSIIPALTRVAVEPYEHDGLALADGERVVTSFVTANTDPATFPDPERFEVSRSNAGDHLTFGWGPHFCVGAGLARIELQEALRALVTRFGPPTLTQVEAKDVPLGFVSADALEVAFPAATP